MGDKKALLKFTASLLLTAVVFYGLQQPGIIQSSAPSLGAFLDPFSGFWRQAEKPGTPSDLSLDFEALAAPVTIVLDDRRVPHIFAENESDAAFAQGYLMARDRLWQMDMVIRAISGKLSEVLGESTLEYDRMMRRYGMAHSAAEDYETMRHHPYDHNIALAYAEGVNAYLSKLRPRDYPIEFKLLGYAPQAWEASNLNLVQKYMAMDLCFRADDLAATNALKLFGEERFNFLYPEWNPKQSPIIPSGVSWGFTPLAVDEKAAIPDLSQFLPGLGIPGTDDRIGSNNWAVSGSRTSSGFPILANDPHLSLNLPSIWYELQIHTPNLNAYGVSLPCIPGITIGFNRNIAWGVTNVGHDVLDFYKLKWTDDEKSHYLLDGIEQPVEIVFEEIMVKGLVEPEIEAVKYTEWGPVVKSYSGEDHPDMAMHWLGHKSLGDEPVSTLGVFYKLMLAKGYDDYDNALKAFSYPPQNFALATKDGDIAIRVNGTLPLKRKEQGRFIQDGSLSENAWAGYIPMEQVPQVRNPERGWISSANQHSTDSTYPYYYHAPFDDYRGRYINRVLGMDSTVTVEDMMALQNNTYSIQAEEMLPVLLDLLDNSGLDEQQLEVRKKLEAWDFHFKGDEKIPALFNAWLNQTRRQALDEWTAWNDSIPVLVPQDWRLLELLKDQPGDVIFDIIATPEKETASEVVTRAYLEVCRNSWEEMPLWEDAKPTVIQHMGRIEAFSVPVKTGGYRQAPNAMSEGHGPSWRMVVELGPEPKAFGVFPGGPSGNPGSPYYDLMIDEWAAGEYFPLYFMDGPDDKILPKSHKIDMQPYYPK